MHTVSVVLDRAFRIAPVRRAMFGSFIEQMGRAVYGGIFDPGHPHSNDDGFRLDVIEMVRDLGISTVRYPGGNFVSGYHWEDGVGPVSERSPRLDLAWSALEPNTFGLDEFVRWSRLAGVEPMMAVNLGTRGLDAAVELLEYCNVESGSKFSDLRRQHGVTEPYNIRTWCLGNEMDGDWQLGRKTADEYGRLAAETARAMRRVDRDIQLVACGSSGSDMPWFAEWERVVLEHCYDQVDLISAHAYYFETDGDLTSFLGSAVHLENYVRDVVATIDHTRAAGKHMNRLNISFDEWNVWYQDQQPEPPREWQIGEPRLEDRYSVADAVVAGSMLIALLRNSDRVHGANLAQLVNVIAPIVTEGDGPAWKQAIYHPFRAMSAYASGEVLGSVVDGPVLETVKHGDVPAADVVATWDAESATLALFAVNRAQEDSVLLEIDLRDLPVGAITGAETLSDADPYRIATRHDSDEVVLRHNDSARLDGGKLCVELPPISWSAVRLRGV